MGKIQWHVTHLFLNSLSDCEARVLNMTLVRTRHRTPNHRLQMLPCLQGWSASFLRVLGACKSLPWIPKRKFRKADRCLFQSYHFSRTPGAYWDTVPVSPSEAHPWRSRASLVRRGLQSRLLPDAWACTALMRGLALLGPRGWAPETVKALKQNLILSEPQNYLQETWPLSLKNLIWSLGQDQRTCTIMISFKRTTGLFWSRPSTWGECLQLLSEPQINLWPQEV